MDLLKTNGDCSLQVLWEDGERVVCRGWRLDPGGERTAVLAVLPASEHPLPAILARLRHEYELRDELDSAWASRPLALKHERGRAMLVLEDSGGEPLARLLRAPVAVDHFLRLAIGIASALREVHNHGLVHKDIKPANILVNPESGQVRLTGFGIASRLPRERQAPAPPELIVGTLAYMAPEQTGRMNRSIDSRSDLYALGVTLYQMLTGYLPFTAADPMGWVHCHIARRPVPPAERLPGVPAALSAIIMKLLAKAAEARYQTVAGVERDLRRCLAEWEARGDIGDFSPGQQDMPDRLLVPEKLYGREREVETLLAVFDRVVKSGTPELVLVSGYSGIGKSAVVNELQKALVPPRGFFAAGKFDQYKQNVPYATVAQACQGLVRQILGTSEAEMSRWCAALQEAVGPNGQLMIALAPELVLIIGEQPPAPDIPPQERQARFQFVLRSFLSVFARPEHPLALFLDDLQWLDAATLELMEDLLSRSERRNLLLIGAFRDNELTAAHPLMRKLEAIRATGRVHDVKLAPLTVNDLGTLVADSLRYDVQQASPLAELVHTKTGGNPFFVVQFLHVLADEGLLAFDHQRARWSCDLGGIHRKRYTENVVELVAGKLTQLPRDTQDALRQLACLGNTTEVAMLSIALRMSEQQVHAALWEARRQQLIDYVDRSYRFVHDRVHEAAYALISEKSRAEAHLTIGRLLLTHTPTEKRDEAIFEIVNQLNSGAPLITLQNERQQLAELNLTAGKRAKASAAYASALTYLTAGAALLPEDAWERRHDLIFPLELDRAQCEFLTGELATAEQRLSSLSSRAADTGELATVACLRMDLYTVLGQSSRAVAVCLEYLQRLGIEWLPDPTADSARRAYERIWSMLGDRTIEDLIRLPVMTDTVSLATLNVLTTVLSPAMSTSENLVCLVVCEAVGLSLERGNSDGSCVPYVTLGMIAGLRFGNYAAGHRFGQLACDLAERQGLSRFQARTYVSFAHNIVPWTRHLRMSRELLQRGFDAANAIGDVMFAAYSRMHLNANLLAAGDPLETVQCEAEYGLDFAHAAQFGLVIDVIKTQVRLIRTLRGFAPKFGSLNDQEFDESQFERHLASDSGLALSGCKYWILALQARYLAGDYVAALAALSSAEPLLWLTPSYFETADFHFYGALSHAASWDSAFADQKRHFMALTTHHRQLEIWAANCPENFENRAALAGAEIARLEGRDRDAMDLYERAIRSSRANGFTHNEALAYELAARFYAARGFDKIALTYLQDARYLYLRWGADGKVRQLDQLYPYLSEQESAVGSATTIGASVEHLDLATVIKVSQAVSGEIVLEKLVDTLMRIGVEQAGAERGLLILSRGTEQRIAAEATTGGDTIVVRPRDQLVTTAALPNSVLHYVLRTRESVLLDDATAQSAFAADPYFRQRQAQSVLCLPLITHGKLIGGLYLENNLAPRAFAPSRITVLKLLASQAAIALENTRLYQDLAEREAKIRRLVDANIIGIMLWKYEGPILEANDAFLRIVGYDREDLLAGRLRWTDLTPPAWRALHERSWTPEIRMTGRVQPYEKEFLRKDGSRVPVLVGATSFDETGSHGVSFVLDLTERKQAEQALRRAQAQLTHLARVMTIGELTASIAHEINQPLAAIAMNSSAGLRWLARHPPDLDEARACLQRMILDSHRAGDVIMRIRSLIKKSPLIKTSLDINEAIQEVLSLIAPEARRHAVLVQAELADCLPPVRGDRAQLQQVILNLAMNGIDAVKDVADRPRALWIRSHSHEVDAVLVAVEDNGIGLDAKNLERVFEAFYSTKAEGMGIGLSISRSIIAAHGGQLWPSANAEQGTTFQFTLPVEDTYDDATVEVGTGAGLAA